LELGLVNSSTLLNNLIKLNQMKSKGIGTKIYEVNKKLGIDKVANGIARAVGKKDCGCKKRAQQLDNVQNKLTSMFQGNKNK